MRFHPESISAEYDILMNSKPYFVYYVANWNPFNSEYFYWLDAGYGHGQAIYPPEGAYWAPENLMRPDLGEKITFIQLGPGNITIITLREMYRQGLTVVNGGFFGGNKRALGEYYHLHNRIFEDLLNRGYVDDDQTLTVLCYQENPKLFNMVVGDWYDVFRLFRLS